MPRFIVQRSISLVFTLFAISIAVFLMVRLLPGNIIDVLFAGDVTATPEIKHQAEVQLGLTGSYPEQYWRWISNLFQGDLGHSLYTSQPIAETLRQSLPITIELVFLGLLIAVVVGLPLGVISAVRRDSAHDYSARVTGLIGVSIPELLARDAAADLHVPGLPLGAAAPVRPVLRGPVQEPPGVHPARDRDLGLHPGDRDADGARDDARGAEPRLRPHGAGEGRAAPDGDPEACAAERADPGRHRRRVRGRAC